MNINLVYSASALAAPQSFRNGMQAAADIVAAGLKDNITVNIRVGYGEFNGTPLSANTSEGGPATGIGISYTNLRNALVANASSSDDFTSISNLPNTSSIDGQSTFFLSAAQEKALGLLSATNGAIDGNVGISTNFTGNVLIAVALHEITHAMGRVPGPIDIFRFNEDRSGHHVFSGGTPATPAYFSIDGGTTDLADFGINNDPSDFLNPPGSNLTPNDPFNEFVSNNVATLSTVDLTIMDVLGFSVVLIADLTALSFVFDGLTAGYQISNTGTGSASASTTGIYISTDSTITSSDMLIASNVTPALGGGVSDAEGALLTFPGNIAPGTYFLGALADSAGQITEKNELNNASNVAQILLGDNNNNTLTGTSSNEILIGQGGNDSLDGGGGNDTASYAGASSAVTVSLAITTAQNTGGAGTDTLVNIENLAGSPYGDTLTGSSGDNILLGGGGNDMLEGLAGNDYLDGGAGYDMASYANAASGVSIDLSITSPQNTGGAGTDQLVNIEYLAGSAFADTLKGDGVHSAYLAGGAGNDYLQGGAGDDYLDGGPGNDVASYANATSGVNVDLSITSPQNTGGAGTDQLVNIEYLIGSAFADTLKGDGVHSAYLAGGAGNDYLQGGAGDDYLDGGPGYDVASYTNAASGVSVDLSITSPQNTGGAGTDQLVNIEYLVRLVGRTLGRRAQRPLRGAGNGYRAEATTSSGRCLTGS